MSVVKDVDLEAMPTSIFLNDDDDDDNNDDDVTNHNKLHKKLSCGRETARRLVSLNILLSHSRSLKVSK